MLTIFEALPFLLPSGPIKSPQLKTMEDADQAYGFILYRTSLQQLNLDAKREKILIKIDSIRDRSVIMVDQVRLC